MKWPTSVVESIPKTVFGDVYPLCAWRGTYAGPALRLTEQGSKWAPPDVAASNTERHNEDVAEERYLKAQVGGESLTAAERQSILALYPQYQQLTLRAVEVFGSEIEAAGWLSTQSRDFSGRTPLQDLISQGPVHALDVLGKIEHGVFF
jgi:hypothetical protein